MYQYELNYDTSYNSHIVYLSCNEFHSIEGFLKQQAASLPGSFDSVYARIHVLTQFKND